MAELKCVICDYSVSATAGSDDELLALMGVTSAGEAEQLIRHMEAHTLGDWLKAFKMADAYIEKLETQLEAAKASAYPPSVLQNAYREQTYREVPPASPPSGQIDYSYLTPEELLTKQRQAAARQKIRDHNPDETLIPRIPDGLRPEGVVGVKY